jgi:hypothetical protein
MVDNFLRSICQIEFKKISRKELYKYDIPLKVLTKGFIVLRIDTPCKIIVSNNNIRALFLHKK